MYLTGLLEYIAYIPRNDAPSGLTIYLGNLKGARILEAFNPTAEGVPSVNASSKIVKTSIPPGKQVYVTFGSGMSTQKLNNALAPSNLFALGAAHGENFWGSQISS